jgi:hydrogenase/urease accessory protein HupE
MGRFVNTGWCLLALLLILFTGGVGHAHTLGLAGGQVTTGNGEVGVKLDVPSGGLCLFAEDPSIPASTLADLRRLEPRIITRCREDFVLRSGDRRRLPDTVTLPWLNVAAPADVLPDKLVVEIRWRAVPPGTWTVVDMLDDISLTTVLDHPTVSVSEGPAQRAPTGMIALLLQAVRLGIAHIVPKGLDHILFILGLYLAARSLRDLLWQVTAFTVAHCLTLGLTMGGVVVLGPRWSATVELGIALSIILVGLENCLRRDAGRWRRVALAGVFGLVHGLGFAGALSEVSWPEGYFLPALVAANLGIEIGQGLVILWAVALTAWAWQRPWYGRWVVVPASLAVAATGLVWSAQRAAVIFAP